MPMHPVLLVDDELTVVSRVCSSFSPSKKIPATIAMDAVSAEKMASDHFYPVVLTDLRLQCGDDGLRLIETIRRISPGSAVAAMTGYATPDVEKRLLEIGACTLLRKPFETDDFLSTIRTLRPKNLRTLYRETAPRLHAMMARRFGLSPDQTQDVLHQAWCAFLRESPFRPRCRGVAHRDGDQSLQADAGASRARASIRSLPGRGAQLHSRRRGRGGTAGPSAPRRTVARAMRADRTRAPPTPKRATVWASPSVPSARFTSARSRNSGMSLKTEDRRTNADRFRPRGLTSRRRRTGYGCVTQRNMSLPASIIVFGTALLLAISGFTLRLRHNYMRRERELETARAALERAHEILRGRVDELEGAGAIGGEPSHCRREPRRPTSRSSASTSRSCARRLAGQ